MTTPVVDLRLMRSLAQSLPTKTSTYCKSLLQSQHWANPSHLINLNIKIMFRACDLQDWATTTLTDSPDLRAWTPTNKLAPPASAALRRHGPARKQIKHVNRPRHSAKPITYPTIPMTSTYIAWQGPLPMPIYIMPARVKPSTLCPNANLTTVIWEHRDVNAHRHHACHI